MVPISIGTWCGKAIVDTGASYTLIHEYLWMELKGSKDDLQPWTQGPLYLANGCSWPKFHFLCWNDNQCG